MSIQDVIDSFEIDLSPEELDRIVDSIASLSFGQLIPLNELVKWMPLPESYRGDSE